MFSSWPTHNEWNVRATRARVERKKNNHTHRVHRLIWTKWTTKRANNEYRKKKINTHTRKCTRAANRNAIVNEIDGDVHAIYTKIQYTCTSSLIINQLLPPFLPFCIWLNMKDTRLSFSMREQTGRWTKRKRERQRQR